MSDWLQVIQDRASYEAQQLHHPFIRSEHVLLALAHRYGSVLSLSYSRILRDAQALPSPTCGADPQLTLAKGAEQAIAQLSADAENPQALLDALQQRSLIVRRLLSGQGSTHDITT